jgi:hypothetical protein
MQVIFLPLPRDSSARVYRLGTQRTFPSKASLKILNSPILRLAADASSALLSFTPCKSDSALIPPRSPLCLFAPSVISSKATS